MERTIYSQEEVEEYVNAFSSQGSLKVAIVHKEL